MPTPTRFCVALQTRKSARAGAAEAITASMATSAAQGTPAAAPTRSLPATIAPKTLDNDAIIWPSRLFSEKSRRMSTRRNSEIQSI